jgi:hypothetical protein
MEFKDNWYTIIILIGSCIIKDKPKIKEWLFNHEGIHLNQLGVQLMVQKILIVSFKWRGQNLKDSQKEFK